MTKEQLATARMRMRKALESTDQLGQAQSDRRDCATATAMENYRVAGCLLATKELFPGAFQAIFRMSDGRPCVGCNVKPRCSASIKQQ